MKNKGIHKICNICNYEWYVEKENIPYIKEYKYCPYCGKELQNKEENGQLTFNFKNIKNN